MSRVSWDYYQKFEPILDKYMPSRGEGESLASQAVTAVNKLVYKWYNDGDVYDNRYYLEGWANDLSSYANWLYNNIRGLKPLLSSISDCYNGEDYEELLQQLADSVLDEAFLEKYASEPASGSIYEATGPFRFEWRDDDDDEDEYYEDDEDEEDY